MATDGKPLSISLIHQGPSLIEQQLSFWCSVMKLMASFLMFIIKGSPYTVTKFLDIATINLSNLTSLSPRSRGTLANAMPKKQSCADNEWDFFAINQAAYGWPGLSNTDVNNTHF